MQLAFNRSTMILAGAAVVGILAAVAAFLLYGEIARFSSAKEDLNSSKGKLTRFYQNKPFASDKNIAVERESVKALNEWAKKITDSLKKGQIVLEEKTPAILLKQLGDTKKALLASAPSRLPVDFQFGFDRYKEGVPPLANEVKALMEQIVVIETITKLLLEEDVVGIQSIIREESEGKGPTSLGGSAGPGAPPAASSGGRSKRPSAPPPGNKPANAGAVGSGPGAAVTSPEAGQGQYSKNRYEFDFTAKETSLMRILNRLGQHGVFFAVTSIQTDATGSDVRPAPARGAAQKAKEDAGAVPVPAVPAATALSGTAEPPPADEESQPERPERVVSGKRYEAPMKIKMILDAYRFKGGVIQ